MVVPTPSKVWWRCGQCCGGWMASWRQMGGDDGDSGGEQGSSRMMVHHATESVIHHCPIQ